MAQYCGFIHIIVKKIIKIILLKNIKIAILTDIYGIFLNFAK